MPRRRMVRCRLPLAEREGYLEADATTAGGPPPHPAFGHPLPERERVRRGVNVASRIAKVCKKRSKGMATRWEAVHALLDVIDETTPPDELKSIPEDLLTGLQEYAAKAPKTDEEWHQMKFARLGAPNKRTPAPEEIEREQRERTKLRQSVERLRTVFGW